MSKSNINWKSFRNFLRKFDFFGEAFTFRYKKEDKHATELGGIVCIVFYLVAIVYFVINFLDFYHKKNFKLQYYSMNTKGTEKISLMYDFIYMEDNHEKEKKDHIAFAFGITVDNKTKTSQYNISDLFKFEIKYKSRSNENGTENEENNKTIEYRQCKDEDFIGLDNYPFSGLDIKDLKCLNKYDITNRSPEGIYTSENFSYYSIAIKSNHNNETYYSTINKFLTEFDCKLQFYYTDLVIDLDKVENPFSFIFNSIFIQLEPNLVKKKNIFFMNFSLNDEKNIIHNVITNESNKTGTGLSRVEDYSLYKGLDRFKDHYEDYNLYAKMYVRADSRKVVVKRTYQDFMEFYADTSGLLLSIFWLLGIIFAYFDRVKANHSISKKLFFFEGISNNKFNQFKQLKEIIQNDEEQNNILRLSPIQTNSFERCKTFSGNINPPKSNNKTIRNNYFRSDTTRQLKSEENKKKIKKELIDYSTYNIFEMIGSYKVFFCKTKKFKNKINLIQQSNEIIEDKLDIVFYIRKMILFELINKIYLENKTIVNFLSRPIIYLKNKNIDKTKNSLNDLETNPSMDTIKEIDEEIISEKKDIEFEEKLPEEYKSSYQFNQQKLTRKIKNLISIKTKTRNQDNLLIYLKKQLEGIKC